MDIKICPEARFQYVVGGVPIKLPFSRDQLTEEFYLYVSFGIVKMARVIHEYA